MDYQERYRASGCPMRRQDLGQETGTPGTQMREAVGYAPGMQIGQPDYGMEMQPEYGAQPYDMQPYRMNMPEQRNRMPGGTDMPEQWNRMPGGTDMPEAQIGMPAGGNRMQPGNVGRSCPQTQPFAGAMPYYQMPGYPQTLWQEMESERDSRRLKEMYPDAAKEILPYVEEECDKMEYDGSVMFDEYPDRVMTGRIRNNIYDRVKDRFDLPEDSDRDEMFAMNQETRRRYPPRKNWLGDLVDVLLFQEMHRRRCRHRNCRGWR